MKHRIIKRSKKKYIKRTKLTKENKKQKFKYK